MTQQLDNITHHAQCWYRRTNGVALCTCGPLHAEGVPSVPNPRATHVVWENDGNWRPNRDPATETGGGWEKLIQRLGLNYWPETERMMLRGQDGWAFGTALRFQMIAHELAQTDEQFYWSGYHLLALIVERARTDLVFLEAIEALAVAHLYGGLSPAATVAQLKQLGVWP